MTDHYTPRTDQVRAVYVLDSEAPEATGDAFDRWLDSRDHALAERTIELLRERYILNPEGPPYALYFSQSEIEQTIRGATAHAGRTLPAQA